jgi:hypothetical protein
VATMNMTALWEIAPCRLVEVHRRFRVTYCLHHRTYDGSYCTCKSSADFNETARHYFPEGCHLQARLCSTKLVQNEDDLRSGSGSPRQEFMTFITNWTFLENTRTALVTTLVQLQACITLKLHREGVCVCEQGVSEHKCCLLTCVGDA